MRILPLLVILAALVVSPLHSRAEILVKNGESIAFLGDSITQFGAQSGPGGYVRLVESGLASQGIRVTVIPAGLSANKSNDMLARLEKDVLSKKPTWMTLSVGVNDVMHGARGVELEDYKKNVTAILDRAQQAGVKVVILTATQIGLPVTNPENTKMAAYNTFLRETAKARNLPLADLNAAMVTEQASLEMAGIKRALTTDGVHMNIYGDQVMARGVLAAFGLNYHQLTAVQAKWNEMPDLFQTAPRIKLSLAELAALEAYAAKQNKSVDSVVAELSANAISAAIGGGPGIKIFKTEGFTLALPHDVTVQQELRADFVILSFKAGDKQILAAYAGNHPSFPSNGVPPQAEIKVGNINGLQSKTVTWKDQEGTSSRDTLIRVHDKGWPTYVHIWYSRVSKDSAEVADKIIESLRAAN